MMDAYTPVWQAALSGTKSVFVAPSLLLLVLLLVLPLGQAIVTSLTVKGAFSFDNYARALGRDDLVRLALGHTLVFSAVSTLGQYVLGAADPAVPE